MKNIKIYHARISNIYTLPERIGVYVITHTRDNVHAERYVGVTTNLHSRMYGHYKKIIYVDLYVVDDVYVAQSLERILIELIKPITNTYTPRLLDDDKNLMNEILENTKIKLYIFEDLIRIGCRHLKYISKKNIPEDYEFLCKSNEIYMQGYKSVSIPIEVYNIIIEKQFELIKKNGGKYIEINYVTESAILLGIDKVE